MLHDWIMFTTKVDYPGSHQLKGASFWPWPFIRKTNIPELKDLLVPEDD